MRPKDREVQSWMTEGQMVGRLPDDDCWTADIRRMNWVFVEEHPMDTRSGTSVYSGLASLSKSSRAIPAKQETVALQAFLVYLFVYLLSYLFHLNGWDYLEDVSI